MKRMAMLASAYLVFTSTAMAVPLNIGSAGDIHFTMTIREATCELEQDNIEVDMGTVMMQRPVRVGKELSKKAFSIGLKNCAYAMQANVTMDGVPDATDPNLFALEPGGATGVGLKIATAGGVQQFPVSTNNAPVENTIWFDGSNKLNYVASYVTVSTAPTTGAANATVNFTVQYE